MTTLLSPLPKFKAFDNNGNPLAFGLLTTYAAGTTNPIATYKDSTQTTTNTNPIVLNFRGEADIWLIPNIAYKFALTDSQGNTIPGWPVDNIVNSQLITLYGGVDTGSVNAYVINFTANFTSLTDGIIIAWIAAHANTGASTINVNGLGIVNLLNQDLSALRGGQITANQVVQMMYKGGNWLLLAGSFAGGVLAVPGAAASPSISFIGDPTTGFYFLGTGQIGISQGGIASGSIIIGTVSGSLTGVSGTVNVTAAFSIFNNVCALRIPQISGTSNATSFGLTFTGNSVIRPTIATAQYIACAAMQDNGSALYSQVGFVAQGSPGITNFTFYKNGSASGWTNVGTKGIGDGGAGQVANIFVYPLS